MLVVFAWGLHSISFFPSWDRVKRSLLPGNEVTLEKLVEVRGVELERADAGPRFGNIWERSVIRHGMTVGEIHQQI